MPVCYGYGRHSTNMQGVTEEVQRNSVYRYWELELQPKGVTWGGWFYDKAKSASIPFSDRPEGLRVWLLLQPGDHIAWHKLDRAFRSVHDGCANMEMLRLKGVTVHSLDLRIDTSTPLGKFFQTVVLAVAQLEKEYISLRTKEAVNQLKADGKPYSTARPFGWRKIVTKKTRYFAVDPDERRLVEHLYGMQQSGKSWADMELWSYHQKQFKTIRKWHIRNLRWAMMARRHDYPRSVYTYEEMLTYHRSRLNADTQK